MNFEYLNDDFNELIEEDGQAKFVGRISLGFLGMR